MFVILFFFLSLFSPLFSHEYVICYQKLTSGGMFVIENKQGEMVGKVLREQKGEDIYYSYINDKEISLISGKTEYHELNTTIHLATAAGKKMGGFDALIRNVYPIEYRVYSKEDKLIAVGPVHWLGNSFVLEGVDHVRHYIASYFRPMFKLFNDNWHFQIHHEGIIELPLLCIIGAFQTACDLHFEMLDQ